MTNISKKYLFSSGTNYCDMCEYNPQTNTCDKIDDFSGTPRRYLASMVIDGMWITLYSFISSPIGGLTREK